MKHRHLLTLATLAVGATLAPVAKAEFDPSRVPADSKWVVYADFAALRETELGQQLIARVPMAEEFAAESPVRPDIGKIIDAIGSITGFGSLQIVPGQEADMTGALVIEGTADLRKIAEGLMAHATLSNPDEAVELTGLPIEAYQMHGEIVVGFPEEPIILVGRSPDKLTEALSLYRGQGKSIASGKHALTELLPGNQPFYIYAASLVPSEAIGGGENTPQARVLQMTKSAAVTLGESGEDLVAQATLQAADNSVAERLVKILNGLTAMLSLAESDDADLTAFLNSVRIQRDDTRVSLRLAYPTARLVQMFEETVMRPQVYEENKEQVAAGEPAPSEVKLEVEGEALLHWTGSGLRNSEGEAETEYAFITSDPVDLAAGARLIVTGEQHEGELARVDYIELLPVDGGDAIRYEAEFMRLRRYRIEERDSASGGELVRLEGGRGTAQLMFHGPAGSYRVRVCYIDEIDGISPFALSVVAPTS
ncbi:hypothetical protein [Actomonas aquatica]|uniref:Uncharacterized protein n=1 Tax=Actomonas aquatica TaxID=2866162 RepID=A0ABZ1C2B5_9BACT|nr:hypothetical protein [Opitutus sp. WL0086]WRQ85814.1 hypothetical protein K1X11_013460 [Opitutus sp. WL0086]